MSTLVVSPRLVGAFEGSADGPASSPISERRARPSLMVASTSKSLLATESTSPRARSKSVFLGVASSISGGVGGVGTSDPARSPILAAALQRFRGPRAGTPDASPMPPDRRMSRVEATTPLSTSDVNRLRKQTYELTSTGVTGRLSAKKLWRSGMLRLFSLRNAFDGTGGANSDVAEDLRDQTPISPNEGREGVLTGASLVHSNSRRMVGGGGGGGAGGGPSNGGGLHSPLSSASFSSSKSMVSLDSPHGAPDRPLQSWEAMMGDIHRLNTSHVQRYEGKSATITLRETPGKDNNWLFAGEVGSGMYCYLHLPIPKQKRTLINQLRIQIQPLNASVDDLELFVCCTNKLPSRHKHSWKLNRQQKLLILSKHDPRFTASAASGGGAMGHFYISVYGFGKNVSMITFALKIQASEDTFVPYNQLLLQGGGGGPNSGSGGGGGALSASANPLFGNDRARDTTAKNRIANKLYTIKHDKRAFEAFQRKVQTIIETRMAGVAPNEPGHDDEDTKAGGHDTHRGVGGEHAHDGGGHALEGVGSEGSVASPLSPSGSKKRPINFIAANRAHTDITLHAPSKDQKKSLLQITRRMAEPATPIDMRSPRAAAHMEASAHAPTVPGAATTMMMTPAEHSGQLRLSEQEGAAAELMLAGDQAAAAAAAAEEDEQEDIVDEDLMPANDFQLELNPYRHPPLRHHQLALHPLHDYPGFEEDGIDEEVILEEEEKEREEEKSTLEQALDDVEEESNGEESLPSQPIHPLAPSTRASLDGAADSPGPSSKSLDARRPSAIKTTALHSNGAVPPVVHSSGATPNSSVGGGSGSIRRNSRRTSSHSNLHGIQVPLTPVNLHLHDLLTAQQDEEAERFAAAGYGAARTSPRGSRSHSRVSFVEKEETAGGGGGGGGSSDVATLQQKAAEKLRRLSKDHGGAPSTSSLHEELDASSHVAAIPPALAAVSEMAPSGATRPHASSSHTSPITSPPMSPRGGDPRQLSGGGLFAPLSPRSNAPSDTVNTGPGVGESASQVGGGGETDREEYDTEEDQLEDETDEVTTGSNVTSVRSRAGRRRRQHSRATSFYTEVSIAPSSASGDTHSALLRTVARHEAEGGDITAVGSARKFIRMPFARPKSSRRSKGPHAGGMLAPDGSQTERQSSSSGAGPRRDSHSSQTARDLKQPARGTLSSRNGRQQQQQPEPVDLAAKSALLRQTVENNLKLTQFALNKKVAAAAAADAALTPKVSSAMMMIDTHGAMSGNEYETTQAAQRSAILRKNNPAKWMGRNFAVRAPAEQAQPQGESLYMSGTSKTHRIKLELAYLHRTTRIKKTAAQVPGTTLLPTAVGASVPAAAAAAAPATGAPVAAPAVDSLVALLPASVESAPVMVASSHVDEPRNAPPGVSAGALSPGHPAPPVAATTAPHLSVVPPSDHADGDIDVMPASSRSPHSTSASETAHAPTLLPGEPALPHHALSPVAETLSTPDADASAQPPPPLPHSSSAFDAPPERDPPPHALSVLGFLTSVAEGAANQDTASSCGSAEGASTPASPSSPSPMASGGPSTVVSHSLVDSPSSSFLSPLSSRLASASSVKSPQLVLTKVKRAPFLSGTSSGAGGDSMLLTAEKSIVRTLLCDPFWMAHFFHTATPAMMNDPILKAMRPISAVTPTTGGTPTHANAHAQPEEAPAVGAGAKLEPLVLPSDHLSQLCLCLDFAHSQRALLDLEAKKLEDGILARLSAQHTLLLDNDAALLSMPTLPAEHPIRDHPFFLTHPLPSVVRWSPLDAKEHAALGHARAQKKRLDLESIELEEALRLENIKLDQLKHGEASRIAEAQSKVARAADVAAAKAAAHAAYLLDLPGAASYRQVKVSKSAAALQADQAARRARFGLGQKSQAALVLHVNAGSELAHALLTPSASSHSLLTADAVNEASLATAMPDVSPVGRSRAGAGVALASGMGSLALKPSSVQILSRPSPPVVRAHEHVSRPASGAVTPRSPSLSSVAGGELPNHQTEEFDIDATAASHLQAKTIHEWMSKATTATPTTTAASAALPQASADVVPLAPAASASIGPSASAASRPSTRETTVTSSQSTMRPSALGRRSSFSVRPLARREPTAAELLYGQPTSLGGGRPSFGRQVSTKSNSTSASSAPSRVGRSGEHKAPFATLVSPRTRRIVRQAIGAPDDLDDEEEEELEHPQSWRAHAKSQRPGRRDESKEDDTGATSGGSGKKPRVFGSLSSSDSSASLASSFVRLTHALSSTSVVAGGRPLHSARSDLGAASLASPPLVDSESCLLVDEASRVARQTRLAHRKQAYTSLAKEMQLERAEEMKRLATHSHHRVPCERGLSQSFAHQLTPVLNAEERGAFGSAVEPAAGGARLAGVPPLSVSSPLVGGVVGRSHARVGSVSVYTGVTSTSYDARHLSHQPFAALRAEQSRLTAVHWRDADQLFGVASALPARAAARPPDAYTDTEEMFKSTRMLYARINYIADLQPGTPNAARTG